MELKVETSGTQSVKWIMLQTTIHNVTTTMMQS